MLSIVVAVAHNDVIGRDNDLPWHLPGDLRWFKQLTAGHVVLMGRRTHESIVKRLGRALPNRLSVVLSHSPLSPLPAGVVAVRGVDEAVTMAQNMATFMGREQVFVIGGQSVYAALLPQVQRLYVTRVEADVAGDATMPPGWLDGFDRVHQFWPERLPNDQYPYCHERYVRR
jgi:dihydrofolate reductase